MTETTVEIKIPDNLLQFGLGREEIQQRVNEWLVLSLFADERISSGRAARLLEISRVEFLALLRDRGIAYIDYTKEELEEEFAAVDALKTENVRGSLSRTRRR
jgi:predicted HTH domain antitoxin